MLPLKIEETTEDDDLTDKPSEPQKSGRNDNSQPNDQESNIHNNDDPEVHYVTQQNQPANTIYTAEPQQYDYPSATVQKKELANVEAPPQNPSYPEVKEFCQPPQTVEQTPQVEINQPMFPPPNINEDNNEFKSSLQPLEVPDSNEHDDIPLDPVESDDEHK